MIKAILVIKAYGTTTVNFIIHKFDNNQNDTINVSNLTLQVTNKTLE